MRHKTYTETLINGELDKIVNTPEGRRSQQVYESAHVVKLMVGTSDFAKDLLIGAGTKAGLRFDEVAGTVERVFGKSESSFLDRIDGSAFNARDVHKSGIEPVTGGLSKWEREYCSKNSLADEVFTVRITDGQITVDPLKFQRTAQELRDWAMRRLAD